MRPYDSPDGFPTIEPTRERVDEFLRAVDRDPDEVVGDVPPSYTSVDVETVAANAVMAGCAPDYLPVVLAALEASIEPEFNLYGVLATTHPCWPAIIVNGPITEELGIESGANAYGQGNHANATIGRALSFVYMHVGGAVSGQGDMATHGGPHKYGLCVAENEAESPWEPLHVERGLDADQSAVTVVGAESPHNINDHVSETPQGLLTTAANTMAKIGTNLAYLNKRGEPHLVLSPEHAAVIADGGWSKNDIKRFLYDNARIPYHLAKGHGMYKETGGPWPTHFRNLRNHQSVGLAPEPENFIVTVTGGDGRQSLFHPSFGDTSSVTRPI